MIAFKPRQTERAAIANGIKMERGATTAETFPTVFAQRVAAHPHKPAIVSATRSVTYGELNEEATRIAAALVTAAGLDAEPVALLFDQEISAFAATIGVLQSGKFYVTLDPLYPSARLTEILTDAEAATLLTSESCVALAQEICPIGVTIINVDRLPVNLVPLPPIAIPPDAYAYIGYTSGSTGKAKGVIETHRNHLCHWQNLMRAQPDYGNERVLFLNRLSFSGGQLAFYLTFLAGATLYLYDLQSNGVAALPEWIQRHQLTVWNSVPTVFRAFVAQVTAPQQVASIRLLRLASDTILAQDIEAYRRLFAPTCQLWFCYALTEAKTVTMAFLDRNAVLNPTAIPSGQPINGMEIRIVDEAGRRLGPNQVGEILVRSRYVSPGYWGNATMTAERFQPDRDAAGVYLLRTGDLGTVDDEGCLYHKGRKDTQVKIRGYRVELSEVEAHLAALDGVQEVAVRLYKADEGQERLAAYLICSDTPPPSSSQLRRQLEERLPAYMIPNSFTFLERMPVNRNGKIDRAALPIPTPNRPALDRPLTAARTPLEETLVAIWQEVLRVKPIG
ncbi:MAG: amino acid adenylation domain-containing protein, partial [Caldilineaceae bacterium]|nr:amino acid adenylation domain-containing protein [Caldilineaceae bacterium]